MKFALATCGVGERLGIESPSGHVAFAATFYGSLALMLGPRRSAASKLLLGAGVAAFVILVAVSRVALNAHNPAETMVGAATGLAALAIFFANAPKRAPPEPPLARVKTWRRWRRSTSCSRCRFIPAVGRRSRGSTRWQPNSARSPTFVGRAGRELRRRHLRL